MRNGCPSCFYYFFFLNAVSVPLLLDPVNPRGEERLQQYLTARAGSEDTPSLPESAVV